MDKYLQMVEKLSLDNLFKVQTYQEINLDKWKNHEMANTDIGQKMITSIKEKLEIIQKQIDYRFEYCLFKRINPNDEVIC